MALGIHWEALSPDECEELVTALLPEEPIEVPITVEAPDGPVLRLVAQPRVPTHADQQRRRRG